jgi:hypothetical protein
MVIDYSELSEKSLLAIADHFGLHAPEDRRPALTDIFRFHAKRPGEIFSRDAGSKHANAGPEIADAVARWAAPLYAAVLLSPFRYSGRVSAAAQASRWNGTSLAAR